MHQFGPNSELVRFQGDSDFDFSEDCETFAKGKKRKASEVAGDDPSRVPVPKNAQGPQQAARQCRKLIFDVQEMIRNTFRKHLGKS